MKTKFFSTLPIFLILLAGLFTRFFGMNWDQGYHLHPDERAIILFTLPLHPPSSFHEFLSPESPWNPHFFAYGSLPLYLLYSASSLVGKFYPFFTTYDGLLYVGRSISALADVSIILLIYLLGKKYFSKVLAEIAAFFYLCSTFALQAAHFYAVDTLLTLFCLLSLYCLIEYCHTNKKRKLLGFGVFWGFALATKVSAILLIIPFVITIYYQVQQYWLNKAYLANLASSFRQIVTVSLLSFPTTALVVFVCMPYALLDFSEFYQQIIEQSAMTKSAWTFPYTLQYVGKIPYLYEVTQVFFWGQGPFLALICLGGVISATLFLFSYPHKKTLSILLSFFWIYFLVIGNFAVGFMRYMLPLYPLFCICGALWLVKILKHFTLPKLLIVLFYLLITILPLSFLHIYSQINPKVAASNYILNTIPKGSMLAVEHWDDQLPLAQAENYHTQTLELYLEDSSIKWSTINEQLEQTQYIILASNRLYTPLTKLADCQKLLPHPCYKQTAAYYKDLFAGKRGFEKVAEFTSYPTIPFLNIAINDQSADESFTVYDHSKVTIFKRR